MPVLTTALDWDRSEANLVSPRSSVSRSGRSFEVDSGGMLLPLVPALYGSGSPRFLRFLVRG